MEALPAPIFDRQNPLGFEGDDVERRVVQALNDVRGRTEMFRIGQRR